MSARVPVGDRWPIHDVVVGGGLGFATGLALGAFVLTRLVDGSAVVWTSGVLLGLATPIWLTWWHQRRPERPGWPVVAVWVIGSLSAAAVLTVIWALSNFE